MNLKENVWVMVVDFDTISKKCVSLASLIRNRLTC